MHPGASDVATHYFRGLRITGADILLFLLALACGVTPQVSPPELPSPEPDVAGAELEPVVPQAGVVAIGDLHGDPKAAQAVLRMAGIIDEDGHWSAGSTVLVQTGDTTDRGPDSRAVIDILRALEPQAEEAGGRVIALLGNHEVMNLLGDWRYVSEADLAVFGGVEPRRTAFSADGELGRWLRGRDTVALVDGTVFVHGGVTQHAATASVKMLNRAVQEAIAAGDRRASILGSEGPLWYRGYIQEPESEVCPLLEEALGKLGARRMVVGHTTRRDGRIESRCGGRVAVIDTGISAHYGGHLAAWTSVGGDAAAIYPSGRVDLEDPR